VTKFVRVSLIGSTPVTHITISEAAFKPSKHRLLKSPALDRNGNPRSAKYGTSEPAPDETSAESTTTGQEATK
jgi:hypothetical protein